MFNNDAEYEIKPDIDLNILVDKYGFKEYKYYYKRKTNGVWIKVYKDSRFVFNPTCELPEIEDLYKDNLLQEIDWVPLFWEYIKGVASMCIEDLFIPGAFDEDSRVDILVDTKRRLIDDQKSFKYILSTNLDTNKYIEEAELDLSIFEPTDLQKAIYEWFEEVAKKEDLRYGYTRAYRYNDYENIY